MDTTATARNSSGVRHVRRVRIGIGATILIGAAVSPRVAAAQATTKTFFDYIEKTPVTCPLTSSTWGCPGPGADNCNPANTGVLPRDTCNGLENTSIPPAYYYWDGKVIQDATGMWHLFADRWAGSGGFGNWVSSEPIHAKGGASPFGPFMDSNDYVYSDSSFGGDSHHGHNSSAFQLIDGTYGYIASEVVPFTVWTATSLDGPWTACPDLGGELYKNPNNVNTGYDGHWDSNVSVTARPDGKFEAVQRHGLIAIADTVCGPYNFVKPTNAYPANEQPSGVDSIYPNRQVHTDPLAGQPNGPPMNIGSCPTYSCAEDPVIWYSGGLYHVLYDYPDPDRVGYHLTSPDGINGWTDQGFAYDPRLATQIFSYADAGAVNWWNKMERPGIVLEKGHVIAATWAVSDVDKNDQIPAGSNHGSKVVVIPVDGVSLDCDLAKAGFSDAGCSPTTVDAGAEGGTDAGSDATAGGGSSGTTGGSSGGGSSSGGNSGSTGGGSSSGGSSSSTGGSGDMDAGTSGSGSSSGCGCVAAGTAGAGAPPAGGVVAAFFAWLWIRPRRRRSHE